VKTIDIQNIEELKTVVEQHIGYKVKYAKNCDSLSEYIFEKTGQNISSSTLKRFWGIIKRKFNPSVYTLNTLAILVGEQSWDNFCSKKNERTKYSDYTKVKEKFNSISKANINFVKKQSPSFFYRIGNRSFAIEKMERFLKSDKKAMHFISHDGFGKTELLVRMSEHFFLGSQAIFPNDLCLFINFKTVNISEYENFDIYHLLSSIFKNEENEGIEKKIKSLLESKRLIIFFDRICKIYKNDSVFPKIIKEIYEVFIGKYSKYDIKLIMTCKSEHWPIFEREFKQSNYIKDQWFETDFNNPKKSNIPALNRNEIISILKQEKKEFNYSFLLGNNKLLNILSIPYFLHIYINSIDTENNILDELDLLNFYLKKEVLAGNYAKEKMDIIEKIIEESEYGKKEEALIKSNIKLKVKEKIAFNQLININFISESMIVTDYFEVTTQIHFSNVFIFKFLIINSWLRKNGLSTSTIIKILDFYEENDKIRINLLNWIIKYASQKNVIEIFENIFQIINTYFILGDPRKVENRSIKNLIDTIGSELRKNKELRDRLIPIYAKEVISRDLYFRYFIDLDYLNVYYYENIDYFLKTNVSKNDIFFVHVLKFLQHYLDNTIDDACNYIETLENISNDSKQSIYQINTLCCSIICKYLKLQQKNNDEIVQMYILFNKVELFNNKYEQNTSFFLVMETLEITENYDLIIDLFTQNTLLNNPKFVNRNHYLSSFLSIFRAKALVKNGNLSDAFKILNQVDSTKFSEGQRLYWNVKFNFASYEYYRARKNFSAAKKMIVENIKICKTLNYNYYFNKSSNLIFQIEDLEKSEIS